MAVDMPAVNGPLSWRDVYAAVEKSEIRVLGRIDEVVNSIKALDAKSTAQHALHDGRIVIIEDRHDALDAGRGERRRIAGVSKGFIVGVVTIANVIIAIWIAIANQYTM